MGGKVRTTRPAASISNSVAGVEQNSGCTSAQLHRATAPEHDCRDNARQANRGHGQPSDDNGQWAPKESAWDALSAGYERAWARREPSALHAALKVSEKTEPIFIDWFILSYSSLWLVRSTAVSTI